MSAMTAVRRPEVAWRTLLRDNGVYLALAALLLFNAVATSNFLTVGNARTQLIQAAPVIVVALGMALVIGTQGIDLSVGAVMALAAAVLPLYLGYGPIVAIVMALLVGLLAGALNGSLVAFVGVQPIVATLALFVGGRGVALVLADGQLKSISNDTFLTLGTGSVVNLAAIPRRSRREVLAGQAQRHGAVVVLMVVALVASFSFPDFGTSTNLTDILLSQSFLAIVAIGMTFVIISGGIDLSVGSVFALGGVVGAWASQYGLVVGLLVPLLLCGAIGLINGLLVAYAGMAPFIVTLASLLGARGLLLALSDEGATTYAVPGDGAFHALGSTQVLGLNLPVWIALGLVLVFTLVLTRTRFGHAVLALGGSEDAASLMGLRVQRTKVLVYLMSGLLAGLAGALNAAWLSSGVTILGTGMELDVIAAVVIGGTLLAGGAGSVVGSLAGVLLLGVIQNLINQVGSLNSSVQSVVSGAFLIVVVVLQRLLSRTQRL